MKSFEKNTSKFPKKFFSNLKPSKELKKTNDYDKPFEWSQTVLDGKSKVKLVSLKNVKN